MTMESPVRICLSAAIVVHLLLLSNTTVTGTALPKDTNSTVAWDDKPSLIRPNNTWTSRSRHKNIDVAFNELNPKEPDISEDHTEKNVKSRGRVRFHSLLKTSTESPLKRVPIARKVPNASTAQTPSIVIVTPTPEVKKPAQIIDSMRTYKKVKMPTISSTHSTLLPANSESTEDDGEQNNKSYEKYSTRNIDDIPSFKLPNNGKKGGRRDSRKESDKHKINVDYTSEPYGYENYFSNEDSFKGDKIKTDSYFNFDADLTTPKNEFFDKKFQKIQQSIVTNLESVQSKLPNMTIVRRLVKQNFDLDNRNNSSPKNKSTVFFKNTKEFKILDNEKAGTTNTELSDVQGTSIYYEMSVLSTETYNINNVNDEGDCDESAPESTVGTVVEQALASINDKLVSAQKNISKEDAIDSKPESINTLASDYLPFPGNVPDVYDPVTPLPYSPLNPVSSQNYVSSTEKSKLSSRNKASKRLNFTGTKETLNIYTTKPNAVPTRTSRPSSRRFHYTTPKIKPIWMAPRRNSTRNFSRSTVPTTIYQEYFDIKDKYTTTVKPKDIQKSTLSTETSEIDPVQQSDISGIRKIVHSHSVPDNSIPSLWKRGSTKFSTSTTLSSTETNSGVSEMEIPPTLTAWALASLRSPPSMSTSVLNGTSTTQKSVDENDLQKVGEIIDKKESSSTTTTTLPNMLSSDVVKTKVHDIDQNRLSWQQIFAPSVSVESQADVKTNESTMLKNTQSSRLKDSTSNQSESNEGAISMSTTDNLEKNTENEEAEEIDKIKEDEKISTMTSGVTNFTGFESITKLPAEITTPREDIDTIRAPAESEKISHAFTDYEITTIRFSYIPTEETVTEDVDTETTPRVAVSTRTKTTIIDGPITTYRPPYVTYTEIPTETSTIPVEISTMPATSVTYQNETGLVESTAKNTDDSTHTEMTTESMLETEFETTTTSSTASETTLSTQFQEELTSTVVEIVTEINKVTEESLSPMYTTETTEYETSETPSSQTSQSYEILSSSEENEVITQEIAKPTTTTTTPATTVPVTVEIETTSKVATTETAKPTESETITPTEILEIPVTTVQQNAKISETTTVRFETTSEGTTDSTTKSVSGLEDITSYSGEMTTEASIRVLSEETGAGAAIAIAVSTIGVIALILLVGLLLVVRRRGRRGAYAHRCTPVSLDAYSLDSVSVGPRKGQRVRASKRSYGNPAYDDEVTSHPMQFAALANFALDIDSMTAEFSEIPTVTVRPDEVPPGCEDKNRYSNVLPLPETRVPLARIGNDPTTEYINANYITGPGNIRNYYIACQAPLASTVSDFWRMVWEQNSRVIVMLTEYMENGVEKCYEYLPPSEISDNRRTFGEYQIILKKREQKDKYAVSSVQLINLTTRTWREITHLWYFWPAKGVPDDYDSVIDFLSEMRGYMKISQAAKEYDEDGVEVIYEDENRSSFQNLSKLRSDDNSSANGVNVYSPAKAEEQLRRHGNGTLSRMKAASEVHAVRPCVVVCASGAGRSAAIIAADVCARALAAGVVDVPRVVRELRAQRPHSLANRHHYILLYKVLSEYGNKLMGGGVDTI